MNQNTRNSNTLKTRILFTQGMFYFLLGISLPLITIFFFEIENLYWSIPSSILPIVLGGYFLYYFEIDNEKLIVKNLIFFWVHKEYKKNKINDITVSLNYGTSDEGNDVITKHILIKTDNKSKKYLLDYNERYYIDLYYKLEKHKYQHNIFKSAVHKTIITKPKKEVHITFELLKNKKYLIADNYKLIQNITTTKIKSLIFFGIGGFFLLLFLVIGMIHSYNFFERLIFLNGIYILPMLIGFYYLFLFYLGGKKVIVYNRKENTITYPYSKFSKKTITISFNKFKFHQISSYSSNFKLFIKF